MGKSPPVPSTSGNLSPTSDPTKTEKRRQRLLKNRHLARNYRVRDKARVHQLEAQVLQLSEEAARLQIQAERAKQGCGEDQVTAARSAFLEKIRNVAADPATGDEEIEALIDEVADTVGPRGFVFVDCLRTTFQRTVAMLIPEPVLLSLALGEERLVELRSLLQASLSPEQFERFLTMQRESAGRRVALAEALEDFKTVAWDIWRHSDVLHSLIRSSFKAILQPRQIARTGERIHKLFRHLETEQVLYDGRNSTELLKE